MGWFDWLKGKKKRTHVKITQGELYRIFLDRGCVFSALKFADTEYTCMSRSDVAKILRSTRVQDRMFTANRHDCDNFALEMAAAFSGGGWAFGEYWGDVDGAPHAINVWIDEGKNVCFLEPQTAEVVCPVITKTRLVKFC